MSNYTKCSHVTTKGTICQSPALQNHQVCYFHQRDRQRRENFAQARQLKQSKDFAEFPAQQALLNFDILESLDIPALDDAASIQVATTNILRAVLAGHIDTKRARLALYALQIAAINLSKLQLQVFSGERVPANDPEPIRPLIRPIAVTSKADIAELKKQIANTMTNLHPAAEHGRSSSPDYFPFAGAATGRSHERT